METCRKRQRSGPADRGCGGAKQSTRRISAQQFKSTVPSFAEGFPLHTESTKRLPFVELCPGQKLDPSTKIKLQLFPIDEDTCIVLEKDGYHPYLELTLSARKKISSVLKRIISKWGSSSIAIGDPMLFPYDKMEILGTYQWTLNDSDVSAWDVYAAIGSPDIFRLRYGWFCGSETKSTGVPCISTPFKVCLESKPIQSGTSANAENNYGDRKQSEVTNEEFVKALTTNEATNAVVSLVTEKMSSNEPVNPKDNEVRVDSGIGQSTALWADSFSYISIGGLLSEASLQGKLNNCNPKSNGSNAGPQPSQLLSDSFDGFLAGQIYHSQGAKLLPHDSYSSILDAEDTCHAFAFQKLSSSSKGSLPLDGSACPRISTQNADFKSFKFPNLEVDGIQSELPRGHSQKLETDLQLCSRVYNDESSLGLSGIKWTESSGPFDLGLSTFRKITSGDKVSVSGIVN
ncbi:hypothetical protein CFOL_v3_12942 [Cephalotus follicularis]|uniref:TSL-kinase interacting protein 1 n=1 Tax=Cephalotus follicularis TaxID=3775 RepID=A0A1Q3BN36_CEPFO|nr:hypothetical protein CFOL_v3_12942 [Cephalotus follicularis]